jgi:NAD(P)H-nitrite reductase large subunit
MNKDDVIICRCEEVTEGEIRNACRCGASSVDGVKRVTRAGKGLCQGRTCRCLVENIVAQETGKPVGELEYPGVRPPVRVVKLGALRGEDEEE